MSAHFRKEEEAPLPVLARHGGDLSHPALVEVLTQHARILGLVMELGDEVNGGHVRPETLWNIGERLEEHIRLEEREAFTITEEPSRRRRLRR